MKLRFLGADMTVQEVNVVQVEASDIRPLLDTHVKSVEVDGGWWEVYQLADTGEMVAYFLDEDDL